MSTIDRFAVAFYVTIRKRSKEFPIAVQFLSRKRVQRVTNLIEIANLG